MTICDIAKMAGVSATTVSRVINNKGYVKAEIREKIERLIQEHHYRPSAVACGLIRNNTEMIAVILPDVKEPFSSIYWMPLILGWTRKFMEFCCTIHQKIQKRSIKLFCRRWITVFREF